MNKLCNCCLDKEVLIELTGKDLGYVDIATKCQEDYRILMRSGDNKPTAIIFEVYKNKKWNTVGIVYPDYCPICGRKLV